MFQTNEKYHFFKKIGNCQRCAESAVVLSNIITLTDNHQWFLKKCFRQFYSRKSERFACSCAQKRNAVFNSSFLSPELCLKSQWLASGAKTDLLLFYQVKKSISTSADSSFGSSANCGCGPGAGMIFMSVVPRTNLVNPFSIFEHREAELESRVDSHTNPLWSSTQQQRLIELNTLPSVLPNLEPVIKLME